MGKSLRFRKSCWRRSCLFCVPVAKTVPSFPQRFTWWMSMDPSMARPPWQLTVWFGTSAGLSFRYSRCRVSDSTPRASLPVEPLKVLELLIWASVSVSSAWHRVGHESARLHLPRFVTRTLGPVQVWAASEGPERIRYRQVLTRTKRVSTVHAGGRRGVPHMWDSMFCRHQALAKRRPGSCMGGATPYMHLSRKYIHHHPLSTATSPVSNPPPRS